MRNAWIILLIFVLVGVAWVYLFTGTPPWGPTLELKEASITSIELSWLGTNRTITASDQCAQVIQAMRKARQSPVTTSPSYGTLTLHYADGATNRFYLQPSGRFSGLQLVNQSGGYSISMGEMLDTFESVGLLKKDQR